MCGVWEVAAQMSFWIDALSEGQGYCQNHAVSATYEGKGSRLTYGVFNLAKPWGGAAMSNTVRSSIKGLKACICTLLLQIDALPLLFHCFMSAKFLW